MVKRLGAVEVALDQAGHKCGRQVGHGEHVRLAVERTHPFQFDHGLVDGDVEAPGHAAGGRDLAQHQNLALDGLAPQGGVVDQAPQPTDQALGRLVGGNERAPPALAVDDTLVAELGERLADHAPAHAEPLADLELVR